MSKRELEKFSLKHLYTPYLTSLDYWLGTFSFTAAGWEVVTRDRIDSHTNTNTHTPAAQVLYFLLSAPLLDFKQRHNGYNCFPSSVR